MADAVIRVCYSCKAKLIKQDGCNKITCRCGAKMCYICRKAITDYSHFCNHPRNPGQPCSKCMACYLWEDPELRDNKNINQIKVEAKVEQQNSGLKQTEIGAKITAPHPMHGARRVVAPVRPPIFGDVPRAVLDAVFANFQAQPPLPLYRQRPILAPQAFRTNAPQVQRHRLIGPQQAQNPYFQYMDNNKNNN
uniref:RING-type domain-containing protein n=1 Tax=Romanomermis culicivorax TaxID=13658 RepID=A0A915IW73_ROMCU